MPTAIFGTANLFALVGADKSEQLLRAAVDSGFDELDTAPSYGYGESERAVGRVASAHPTLRVTTKVGIAPVPAPKGTIRLAKTIARRLPARWQQNLRSRVEGESRDRFTPEEVRESVDRSLRRLGRIERLMLHEVTAAEITDDLIDCLQGYRARGDIAALGIATFNDMTEAVLARAPGVFTAVHVAVGPFDTTVDLPPDVTVRVGHGVLGPGATDLHRLELLLRADADSAAAWQAQTAGSVLSGRNAMAQVLFARIRELDLTHVIVATSRLDNVAGLHRFADDDAPVSPLLLDIVERLRRTEGDPRR